MMIFLNLVKKIKMKYILSERQFRLLEQEEKAFSPVEVVLFKRLNQEKEKKKIKKKAEIEDYIRNITLYLGLPPENSKYYTELYLLNFRKDGKYDETTKAQLVDPRNLPGKVVLNTSAGQYSQVQMPFRGSNLTGEWKRDIRGVKYYVVYSYGWYPIYIFKNGRWYEVTKRYSSSTGRQMSNTSPTRYSDELKSEIFWASPEEMKLLERGFTHEEFLKYKASQFEKKAKQDTSMRKRSHTIYGAPGQNFDWSSYTIKFKIKDLRKEGENGVVDIDIYEVSDRRRDKKINYLANEGGFSKEFVEARILGKVGRELRDYIGKKLHWYGEDYRSGDHQLKFNFNHIDNGKK